MCVLWNLWNLLSFNKHRGRHCSSRESIQLLIAQLFPGVNGANGMKYYCQILPESIASIFDASLLFESFWSFCFSYPVTPWHALTLLATWCHGQNPRSILSAFQRPGPALSQAKKLHVEVAGHLLMKLMAVRKHPKTLIQRMWVSNFQCSICIIYIYTIIFVRCFHNSTLQTDAASPLPTSAATGSGEKFSSSSTSYKSSGSGICWTQITHIYTETGEAGYLGQGTNAESLAPRLLKNASAVASRLLLGNSIAPGGLVPRKCDWDMRGVLQGRFVGNSLNYS